MTTTKKRRGRPPTLDKEQALAVAQNLFHEKGFDAVGIAELSETIGVQPPSLYAAFGNKAALFEKTVERYSETNGQFVAAAFDTATSLEDGLEKLLLEAAHMYANNDGARGCLVMENTKCMSDRRAKDLCLSIHEATRQSIATHIEAVQPDLADEIADHIMVALAGMSAAARTGSSEENLSMFAKVLANGLRRALTTGNSDMLGSV
ncbi:MAG: TetR/AcrR family transcriptional regulator [Pseudomonadota bacterium]